MNLHQGSHKVSVRLRLKWSHARVHVLTQLHLVSKWLRLHSHYQVEVMQLIFCLNVKDLGCCCFSRTVWILNLIFSNQTWVSFVCGPRSDTWPWDMNEKSQIGITWLIWPRITVILIIRQNNGGQQQQWLHSVEGNWRFTWYLEKSIQTKLWGTYLHQVWNKCPRNHCVHGTGAFSRQIWASWGYISDPQDRQIRSEQKKNVHESWTQTIRY